MENMSSQQRELLTSFCDVAQDKELADVTLHLMDGDVVVSGLFLAAISPVFRRMLSVPMRERIRGEIVLEHVTRQTWDLIFRFYFAKEEIVAEKNIDAVYPIAHMYDLQILLKCCNRVLLEMVCLENWFSILELANRHEMIECIKGVLNFIRKNFEAVASLNSFRELPQENLKDLLDDTLLVKSEDSVCQAALSWLEQNEVDEGSTEKLFDLIYLEDISGEYMGSRVLYHPKVLASHTLQSRVASAIKTRLSLPAASGEVYKRAPRKSGLLIVVGHDGQYLHVLGARETVGFWVELSTLQVCEHCSVCWLDGSMYITGGALMPRSTFIYNPMTKVWRDGPPLLHGRRNHATASVGQSVFVLGGSNSVRSQVMCIEELNVSEGKWKEVGQLSISASRGSVAAVGSTLILLEGCRLQAFNTVTKTSTFMALPLPKTVNRCRSVGDVNRAFFLTDDGLLIKVTLSEDGVPAISHLRLADFDHRGAFDFLVDNYVRVFGSGKNGNAVEKFCLDGKKKEWSAAPLPAGVRVSGVFRSKVEYL